MTEKWFQLDLKEEVYSSEPQLIRVERVGTRCCGCCGCFEDCNLSGSSGRGLVVVLSGVLFACAVSALTLLSILVLSLDGFDDALGSELASGN